MLEKLLQNSARRSSTMRTECRWTIGNPNIYIPSLAAILSKHFDNLSFFLPQLMDDIFSDNHDKVDGDYDGIQINWYIHTICGKIRINIKVNAKKDALRSDMLPTYHCLTYVTSKASRNIEQMTRQPETTLVWRMSVLFTRRIWICGPLLPVPNPQRGPCKYDDCSLWGYCKLSHTLLVQYSSKRGQRASHSRR